MNCADIMKKRGHNVKQKRRTKRTKDDNKEEKCKRMNEPDHQVTRLPQARDDRGYPCSALFFA